MLQRCFAKNNKVGVMPVEQETFDKVNSRLVTDHVTENRGGVAFWISFVSEEAPKMPPRKLIEMKKGFSEMETYDKMERMLALRSRVKSSIKRWRDLRNMSTSMLIRSLNFTGKGIF